MGNNSDIDLLISEMRKRYSAEAIERIKRELEEDDYEEEEEADVDDD